MKKRWIFVGVVFVLLSMCLLALAYTPQKMGVYVHNEEDILAEYVAADSLVPVENPDEQGGVTISGDYPAVIFDVSEYEEGWVAVRFAQEATHNTLVMMFYDLGEGIVNTDGINGTCPKGGRYAYFKLPEGGCQQICIRAVSYFTLEAVEIHGSEPVIEQSSVPVSWGKAALMLVIALLLSAAVWFADYKTHFVDTMLSYLWKKKWFLLKAAGIILATAVVSFGVEAGLAKVYAVYKGLPYVYNPCAAIFICGVLLTVVLLIASRRMIARKVEVVVFWLILIIGGTMIATFPFAHTGWDVDTHYHMALQDSYLGDTLLTQADMDVVTSRYNFLVKGTLAENLQNKQVMNEEYGVVVATEPSSFSLPHLPAGIAMAVTRAFGFSFYGIYLSGEVVNLLIYALLCYFAMRKLKSGKLILATIAMFPTNIFIACNYSYDYWVLGFSLLGMAYFVGECQREEKTVSVWDTIIMSGSFALACVPKQIYAPLLLIPFFMPKKKISGKKKYYLICIWITIVLVISLLMRSVEQTTGVGDLRGGSDINPSGQLEFILGNIRYYAQLLSSFLLQYLSVGYAGQYVANFGNICYLGLGTTAFVILLAVTVATDYEEADKAFINWRMRCYGILMYVAVAALIATAFYMVYTPVGAEYISGCQGRYLTPLFYPMCALLSAKKLNWRIERKYYNCAILAVIAFFNYMDICVVLLARMR